MWPRGRDHPEGVRAYAQASKKDPGRLLDEVVAVTGWSCDNARRLSSVAKPGPRAMKRTRKPRPRKLSYNATKTLQRVWAFSGRQCGNTSRSRWRPPGCTRASRRACLREGPLLARGSGGVASDVAGDDRPLPPARANEGRAARDLDDEAIASAVSSTVFVRPHSKPAGPTRLTPFSFAERATARRFAADQ